jgi:riboflavin kinase/FMN adenylyltransferase
LNQPTPTLHVEAHLLDFTGDLYGKELEVTFVDRLRDEKKFNSLDELREQIGRDIEAAQARF